MQSTEQSLFADAMGDAQCRSRHAEWLRKHGRLDRSRGLLIDSWIDELAGWIGAARRYEFLGDLLNQLIVEQSRRFDMR